jgi:carboxyl-terminal processing protease
MFFDYATEYRAKREAIGSAKEFQLSDKEYEDFVSWVSKKDFNYNTRSEKLLDELKETASKEQSFDKIKDDFEAMKKTLARDKKQDLYKEKKQIKGILEEEIASRYYLGAGRVEASFKNDEEMAKALEVLSDSEKMKTILTAKK